MFKINRYNPKTNIKITLIFVLFYFISMIFSYSGLDSSTTLLAFTISMSFFLIDTKLGLISLLIFVKWLVLSEMIYPLNPGGDAASYYNFMLSIDSLVDGIYQIYIRLISHINTLIAAGGFLYWVPANFLHSNDMYLLTFVNHMLLFVGSILFVKTLLHLKLLRKKYYYVAILLINFSPLINQYNSWLLKETIVLFFVGLTVYYYYVKRNYLVVALLILLASTVRPYFPIIFASYWYLLRDKHSRKLFIVLISAELVFLYIYSGGMFNIGLLLKNALISWGAFLASPNFLRTSNWSGAPLATLEALIVTLSYGMLLFSKSKLKYIVFQSLILYSLALGQMAVMADLSNFQTNRNALTKVSVGRKKLPIMFINYFVLLLLYERFRIRGKTSFIYSSQKEKFDS